MEKYICIHGHFYQPPRENPWLESIELQDSAYPYHDWNQRITAECYEPNTAARILGADLKIIEILNNYSKISCNFGPTLLYNLSAENPDVYRSIIEADRESMKNYSGHGTALAQVYNHMIMPLASRRDKLTQAIWGIRDFRRRYGREPEGMWLPETAADTETLEVLAELGIRFTILAPMQAKRVKKGHKGARWKDLGGEGIDTTVPYQCQLPSGRSIAIFFYDGEISQEVGFGNILDNGENFARRLAGAFPADDGRQAALVHIATDGESYGHHRRHGEMALSYCLYYIESRGLARLTNYGEHLERHPPESLVEIHENSSWSCVHGVERWQDDCGCSTGGRPDWNQAWRRPLRAALDWLRDRLDRLYESEAPEYLCDPWAARDSYVEAINDPSPAGVDAFLKAHEARRLSRDEQVRALKLLGMQRNAQLIYTSCGWFFDEVSGIETVQVMQYAARAIQLAEEAAGAALEEEFETRLEEAPSNIYGNARNVYNMFVKTGKVDLLRVGAHHAVSSLFRGFSARTTIYSFDAESEYYEKMESGSHRLAVGRAAISSRMTREEARLSSAVLYLGEMSIHCGIRYYRGEAEFARAEADLKAAFERGEIPEVIRLMDRHFGAGSYSLWHLFKDEQRKIVDEMLTLTYKDIEGFHRGILEGNYGTMDFLRKLGIPLPEPLALSAEFILNHDLREALREKELDIKRLERVIRKSRHLAARMDPGTIGFVASAWINSRMSEAGGAPLSTKQMEMIRDALKALRSTDAKLNLWKAQNIYYAMGRDAYPAARARADRGDDEAARWTAVFEDLGNYFQVRVS